MKTIHHVVDIAAPPGPVWAALTTQEGLAGWWSTNVDVDGNRISFTFAGDFNPVMEVTRRVEGRELEWRCTADKWMDNTFPFEIVALDDARTRLRFSQHYAVELSDDDYGTYNFNWGYYLESLRLLCTTGAGQPFTPA
jgi:uncharacterized protein YndB with AHSA1/START domain